MKPVLKTGQRGSTGSAGKQNTLAKSPKRSKQLELFNQRTLKKDPSWHAGTFKDGRAWLRSLYAGASEIGL